jgi:hypothetical protein
MLLVSSDRTRRTREWRLWWWADANHETISDTLLWWTSVKISHLLYYYVGKPSYKHCFPNAHYTPLRRPVDSKGGLQFWYPGILLLGFKNTSQHFCLFFLNRQPKKVAQHAVVRQVYNMRIIAIQDSRCPKQADIVNIEVHEPAAALWHLQRHPLRRRPLVTL